MPDSTRFQVQLGLKSAAILERLGSVLLTMKGGVGIICGAVGHRVGIRGLGDVEHLGDIRLLLQGNAT